MPDDRLPQRPPIEWMGRHPGPDEPQDAQLLQGQDRRYVLTALLLEAPGGLPVAELVARLHAAGFAVGGRPSKTISDALRAEINRGRVLRRGRGRYQASDRIPRTTRLRIQRRAGLLIEAAQQESSGTEAA